MIYLVSNNAYAFEDKLFEFVSLDKGIELLQGYSELGLDTETEGLDCYTKKLLLLQIGNENFQILFDIASFGGIIPEKLVYFLNNTTTLFILQNSKFDLKFLFVQGVIIKKIFDTMLAEIILTNGLQYDGRDLATITEKYCGVHLDKSVRGEIITRGLNNAVLLYGARDVEFLPIIKRKQIAALKDLDLLTAANLDNSFVLVLAYTEFCGIKLNSEKWLQKTAKLKEKAIILKKQLEDKLWQDGKHKYFLGMKSLFDDSQECTINWDSPKQVIGLFKEYGINCTIKVKGVTKESIDAKILEPQADRFSILPPYLKYKEAQKEITTYGENWIKYINKKTGRIHTTFQQLMSTGRLSSGNKRDGTVNLQNIPSDDLTRSCFIPEEGNVLVDADYSSQEQVILANFSKEPNLINFYERGFSDMHSYIAFLMYPEIRRCTVDELTPEKLKYIKEEFTPQRKIAKSAGFAINYGGNGATIAKNCNISKKDGEYVYDSYFNAFPFMKAYFDQGFYLAATKGYITFNNITKRKYFFDVRNNDFFLYKDDVDYEFFWETTPNANEILNKYNKAKSEIQRISQNFPIQGSAADTTKYAGILFMKEILSRGWWNIVKIVNIVHDEYLVECPKYMVEEVKKVLVDCMCKSGEPFCKIVPLKADALHGDHWVH